MEDVGKDLESDPSASEHETETEPESASISH